MAGANDRARETMTMTQSRVVSCTWGFYPTFVVVPVLPDDCSGKGAGRFVPLEALEDDLRAVHAQHVEGRLFASGSHRHGAGLHDQRGMTVDPVACGCARDVADVQMAR